MEALTESESDGQAKAFQSLHRGRGAHPSALLGTKLESLDLLCFGMLFSGDYQHVARHHFAAASAAHRGGTLMTADRGTRLVEDWKPSQATINALSAELHINPLKELPMFIDHFCSVPGARGLKLNWEMTFKNWCRKAAPKAKHVAAPRPQPINAPPRDSRDHLLFWANRLMLRHLISRGGLGSEQLAQCRAVVADTVKWFTQPVREGDEQATPAAFLTMIAKGFGKVSPLKEQTRQAWGKMLKEPSMNQPFIAEMARIL